MNRKYVPLKKLMQEKKELGVVRLPPGIVRLPPGIRPMPQLGEPGPMPETIPVGPLPGIGTGTWRDFIPDIIDVGKLVWHLIGKGNQSGDNPIVLPGVPQGGGGVHGQQPTNPNY